jgi:hypothetical protein
MRALLLFLTAAATVPTVGSQMAADADQLAQPNASGQDAILDSFVPTLNAIPGGTLRLQNRQLKALIMIAYNIGGKQLAGPPWLIDPPGRPGDVQDRAGLVLSGCCWTFVNR